MATAAAASQTDPTVPQPSTISKNLEEISDILDTISTQRNWDAMRKEKEGLEAELKDENLWENSPQNAIQWQKRLSELSQTLDRNDGFRNQYKDLAELFEMADEQAESDVSFFADIHNDATKLLEDLEEYSHEMLMSEEADQHGCFIEIRAGAGGAESCDWVAMLSRMYLRWALSKSFKASIVDEVKGEASGLKSCILQIDGEYAYGWCCNEAGVHRLVRISKHDSQGKRHTSFASVLVFPFDSSSDGEGTGLGAKGIEISPKDLRIEAMRAQGAGGQHVNKTESAVRITHIPTGIIVQCQNERSQHQNKATAMKMLRARLYERELRQKQQEKANLRAELPENAWGSQIRSYVLQPYQMIKDLRTGYESSAVDTILDGDIDEFLKSSLLHHRRKT